MPDLGSIFQFDSREADLRRRLAMAIHAVMRALNVKRVEVPLTTWADTDDEEIVWTQGEESIVLERRAKYDRCPTCGIGIMPKGGE